jgi:hypothetical protein
MIPISTFMIIRKEEAISEWFSYSNQHKRCDMRSGLRGLVLRVIVVCSFYSIVGNLSASKGFACPPTPGPGPEDKNTGAAAGAESPDITHDRGPTAPGGSVVSPGIGPGGKIPTYGPGDNAVSSGGGKTGGGGGSSSPTPAGPSIAEIDRNITRLQQEFTKAQNEYNAAGAEVKRLRDAATPLQDRALKMRERVEPVGSAISAIETRMDEINRVLKSYEDKKIDLRESQALDLKMRKDTLEHELLVKNNEFATLEADYNKAAMDYKAAISKTYPVEEKMHSLDITIHNLKNNIAGWQAARNLMTRNVRDYK